METDIDVSVAMMTYFHVSYVSKAIESVLSQKTKYTYEIVISDDGSTDGTREILEQYQKKYPDKIRVFFNEKNIGITQNSYNTHCRCRGKYIALLSGDDYWIDDEKLQWQAEFLDRHQDYYAVESVLEGRFDDSETSFSTYPKKKYRKSTITLNRYLRGAMFGTGGIMMRNAYLTEEGRRLFSLVPKVSPYIDDATECILILQLGKVYISERHSAVYRVNKNNSGKKNFNAINSTAQKIKKTVDLYNALNNELKPKIDLFYLYSDNVALGMANALLTQKIKDFKDIYFSIPKEYRSRNLLIRSVPGMISFSMSSLIRKAKAKICNMI